MVKGWFLNLGDPGPKPHFVMKQANNSRWGTGLEFYQALWEMEVNGFIFSQMVFRAQELCQHMCSDSLARQP